MLMKVRVVAGPNEGIEASLAPGQVLEVGRSSRCGLVLSDMRMSSVHFALEHRGNDCHLRDLGSRNGVFVNSHRVDAATVQPGDTIGAGESRFAIELAENASVTQSAAPALAPAVPPTVETEAIPVGGIYVRRQATTGIWRYESPRRQPRPPLGLIKALARSLPVYVVVNPTRLELRMESKGSAQFLFDWLPEPAQAGVSPLVFPMTKSPFENADGLKVIESAWGKDAAFCLGSRREPGKVLMHLRQLARGRERADVEPPPGSASGFYFPKVLEQLLTVADPETAQFILSELDFVLLEAPKANGWALLANEGFGEILNANGFEEVDSEQSQ
jgi:hypothetical protein